MVMGGWLFGHSGEHSGRDRGLNCGSFLGVTLFLFCNGGDCYVRFGC